MLRSGNREIAIVINGHHSDRRLVPDDQIADCPARGNPVGKDRSANRLIFQNIDSQNLHRHRDLRSILASHRLVGAPAAELSRSDFAEAVILIQQRGQMIDSGPHKAGFIKRAGLK